MEDRIAKALIRLGEDAGLLSTDTDGLLHFLDDYLYLTLTMTTL